MSKADERHDVSIEQYIESIGDEDVMRDARTIMAMMHHISGEEPILYGIGTIGYGVYKYAYESGRKGEAHTLAFYPRKGKITIYLMDGVARHAESLAKLGKHSTTQVCLYIKRLGDVDVSVLEGIIERSYAKMIEMYGRGPIDHISWQSEK